VTASEEQIRGLLERAERAGTSGQREQAASWLAQAQALAPEHPLVLNSVGLTALHGGDASSARRSFEQALAREAGNAAIWLNLATACRRLGQRDEEMGALNRALTLQPRYTLALLQKASLLELLDRPREAAKVCRAALATISRGAKLPEAVRPAVRHAVEAARRDDAAVAAFVDGALAELRATHAAEPQDRFDHCLDLLTGKRLLYRRQPTFMYFPHLPGYEFYAREQFPWLEELEQATDEVRREFEQVFTEDAGSLVPYISYPAHAPLDQWRELNHSRRWSAFFLWKDGAPVSEQLTRCPRTAELLARMPMATVADHAPTAFFSILDAKTHIPPHTGVTNTRLIAHLPLIVPPGCRFRVGSETREWRTGEAWVFDDTIEHEAWNDSDVPRAILIFDIWNPYLSAAERDLVASATKAYGEYYRDEPPPADAR
jgi:aspartyl/asparaginyl beta-hydroxylase (cupin superfamily)/Flp pilus assembly protein TadD